eukprot:1153792-Pelagomonas_calceolata.AAC.2
MHGAKFAGPVFLCPRQGINVLAGTALTLLIHRGVLDAFLAVHIPVKDANSQGHERCEQDVEQGHEDHIEVVAMLMSGRAHVIGKLKNGGAAGKKAKLMIRDGSQLA